MISIMKYLSVFTAWLSLQNEIGNAFAFQPLAPYRGSKSSTLLAADSLSTAEVSSPEATASGKGFGKINTVPKPSSDLDASSPLEVKGKLVNLLLHMTGKEDEFRLIEKYVDFLEEKFVAPQTLGFLNMAITGEWQFLFTTSIENKSSAQLRLSELVQQVEVDESSPFEGKVRNKAKWALREDESQDFKCFGTFTISSSYKINQGSRMIMDVDSHTLELAKGSDVPKDVPKLTGLLYRVIPKEMFDPNGLGIDTTYFDPDLRIVRHTGKRHEGVRNIFVRSGTVQFDPSKNE